MVMLDLVWRSKKYPRDEVLVAHFDHGMRENAAEDAEFVQRKAEEYGLQCRMGRGDLGAEAPEAEARAARYGFLRGIAKEYKGAEIWTAHHLDDLIESVAINFVRGTGWRGLAVLDSRDIRRPLLETEILYEPMDKAAIFEYAAKHGLQYREDPSNSWDEYLRNRIRHQMNNAGGLDDDQKIEIWRRWQEQKAIKDEIGRIVQELVPDTSEDWERGWFREIDEEVALEILRSGTRAVGIEATRPQLREFREAILNYAPGKYFNLPGDRLVKIGHEGFRM